VLTVWLRGASPAAHSGWGFRAPLESGEEVLVLCPDGSINQAVVWGGLYGPKAPPPSAAQKSIFLTHSSGASLELKADGRVLVSGGGNRVARFDALKAAFDAHIHPTGVGPSGTPTPSLPDAVATVKTEVD
jgi:phage baseplate assembly protein V